MCSDIHSEVSCDIPLGSLAVFRPGDSRMLHSLPPDVLTVIFSKLEPTDLERVSSVDHLFHIAASDDAVWRLVFLARYGRLISCSLFSGAVPQPAHGLSWREHHYSFGHQFMHRAKEYGRLVLAIDGVVCDCTYYLERHPGPPEVLRAAAGHDATSMFDEVGHSLNARRLIRDELAVGRIEELVPPESLACGARALRWRSGGHGSQESQAERAGEGNGAPFVGGTLWSWSDLGRAVVANMRSDAGRSRLRELLRMSVGALVHDLTEGRPDCRRLTPAISRLVSINLLTPSESYTTV